jgi:hypothetical protein
MSPFPLSIRCRSDKPATLTTIFFNKQPIAITKHATAATAWPPAAAAAQAFRRSSAMNLFLNQSASRPQKLLSQR